MSLVTDNHVQVHVLDLFLHSSQLKVSATS
jgi:hypothetical protein